MMSDSGNAMPAPEPMSDEHLDEIIKADGRCMVHIDRFGGRYVLAPEARIYGQRAIIHRRELLNYVAHLLIERAAYAK